MAALLTIAPNWKQPRRPSIGERVITLKYICKTKYHPAIKNEQLIRMQQYGESQKHEVDQKKLNIKENMLYDSFI